MQRDWLTTLPYTTTVYPAIFLRPLSSTPSYTLPTYLPFYLFLLCCYTFKHIYIYKCVCMCVCTRELYTSIGSFRVFFLSIFSLQPLLSIRLSSSVFVRVSILASLSLFLLFFPLHLFFIFSQRLSKRLFRVMHRFLATIPSRVSVLPLLSNLPRALLASLAFTLLD